MISPGSSRAISAASDSRSHSVMRNSPVEMSIQASAKRASSPTEDSRARAIAEQVIVAPGVEQGVFGQRAGRYQPHHVAPHDAFRAALLRLGRVLQLFADGDAVAERDQPVQIFVGADRPARRTSGCPGRDACRAWSARCRARARRSRRPRRTSRRNRPSGRTAGSPDWRP